MCNKLQKSFLLFLFIYALPPIYAMENIHNQQVNNALVAAVESLHENNYQENNWNKILECLQAGTDVNIHIDENKKNLLMLAAEKPNGYIIFNYLLDNKAHVNAGDKYGNTAFHFAFDKLNFGIRDIQICQSLLEHKADPNTKVAWQVVSQTPLFMATQRKNANTNTLIKLLIKHGANFTNQEKILTGWSKYYNCTALGSAIIHNNTPAIEELCNAEAPLINIDEYGNTAFHVITDLNKHKEYNNKEKNITAIMKHSYFEPNKEKTTLKQQLQERFILILYAFKKANIHKDAQLHIFSNLPEYFIFHNKLRTALIKNNYKEVYPLAQVHYHVKFLKKILQIKNKNNQTTLDFYNNYEKAQYPGIKSLLSGEKLKNDYGIFIKKFPAILNSSTTDDNMIIDIYKKYAQLNR